MNLYVFNIAVNFTHTHCHQVVAKGIDIPYSGKFSRGTVQLTITDRLSLPFRGFTHAIITYKIALISPF